MRRGLPSRIVVVAGVASTILLGAWRTDVGAQAATAIAPSLLGALAWRPVGPGAGTFTSIRTDSAFPYRICGGHPDAPATCVASRGGPGLGVVRSTETLGLEGPVAPDPADPDIVFGTIAGGRLGRFDRRTGQTQDVSPPGEVRSRAGAEAPVLFSTTDPRTLYFAAPSVWRTTTAGTSWTPISPDLAGDRGVVSALAPSPVDSRAIWAGTSTGLIHVTRDGGTTWREVTPAAIGAPVAVSRLTASHFDANTGYAVVNAARDGDRRPQIFRTRDAGVTWVRIVAGIGAEESAFAVVEDPLRRGLLFAATDGGVYVSIDDGDRWQGLRQNMPAAAVRDVTIKDSDLVAATEGRGVWILDDISPLRQLTPDIARADAFLFRPATAWRSQRIRAVDADPAPGDPVPSPPDGVVLSYLLGQPTSGEVTLEIIETITGEVIRRFASASAAAQPATPSRPGEARRADPVLNTTAGLHRVVWDLRHAPPPAPTPAASAATTRADDGLLSRGFFVLPGSYQVRLTVGTRVFRQAVLVRMDPRVRTSVADLTIQLKLSRGLDEALRQIAATRAEIGRREAAASGEAAARLRATATSADTAWRDLAAHFDALQQADVRPTPALETAAIEAIGRAAAVVAAARDGG